MEWGQLIRELDRVRELDCEHLAGRHVLGITHDFQEVRPGFIYACLVNEEYSEPHIQGTGEDYIDQALARGAMCVLLTTHSDRSGFPRILAGDPNRTTGRIANLIHGQPLKNMTVVGVTGTNGKTSVTRILASVFTACGKNPGVAGTLGWHSASFSRPTGVYTAPMAADLFRNSEAMLASGVDSLLLESTSHGIKLCRESEVPYNALVFTNFSQDHLDFHGSMEDYIQTKMSLFLRDRHQRNGKIPLAVINIDDPHSRDFLDAAGQLPTITCSLERDADYRACNIALNGDGIAFDVWIKGQEIHRVKAPLIGTFNVYNALLAFAVAHGLGMDASSICQGLACCNAVPGRFEKVVGGPCDIFVDFAHTPDALEKALYSARALQPRRLISVFGCGGDRDRSKRPKMGQIAARLADRVIVTSDNPRTEKPEDIIRDIVAGISPTDSVGLRVEPDRRKAIEMALSVAQKGDVILLAGKGHECFQIIGRQRIPFDDRQVVKEIAAQKSVPTFEDTYLSGSAI